MRGRISNVASLYEPRSATNVADAARPIEEYNKQELGNKQQLPMTKAVVSGKALEESSQEGYAEAVRNVAGAYD